MIILILIWEEKSFLTAADTGNDKTKYVLINTKTDTEKTKYFFTNTDIDTEKTDIDTEKTKSFFTDANTRCFYLKYKRKPIPILFILTQYHTNTN